MFKAIYKIFHAIVYFYIVLFFAICINALFFSVAGAWDSIIGIPEPSFGVSETAPPVPNPWISEVPGFYYVNYLTGSDTGRTFGAPTSPRKTIPSTIPAGSVVELHGATYDQSNVRIRCNGTIDHPVFIRSDSYAGRTQVTKQWLVDGFYTVIENIHFGSSNDADTSLGIRVYETYSPHHVVFRNLEFSGNNNATGGIGVGSWGYTGANKISYHVVDNCYIHNLGKLVIDYDTDSHGVTLNGSVEHFWLVNSELYKIIGDGIQIEAQQGRRDKIHHIYVGNNNAHENKQNGIWVKHATDVIISQNKIYSQRKVDAFSGGGAMGWQYGPEYVWLLANKIYDVEVGIGVGSGDPPGDGLYQYIIGNLIYNVHSQTPTDVNNSGAMMIRGGTNVTIINNTMYKYDAGINCPSDGRTFDIENNIFSGRTEVTTSDVYMEGGTSTANSILKNNVFDNNVDVRIHWGTQYTSLSTFQAATGKGQYSISALPRFLNAADNNFSLMASSPAIDRGVTHSAITVFLNRYGIDIAKDFDGVGRPYGATWDIGAYEYIGGTPSLKPKAPASINIH